MTLTRSSHLFSRQIFWMSRAVLSLPPPGPEPTTNSTGLEGFQSWAAHGATAAAAHISTTILIIARSLAVATGDSGTIAGPAEQGGASDVQQGALHRGVQSRRRAQGRASGHPRAGRQGRQRPGG